LKTCALQKRRPLAPGGMSGLVRAIMNKRVFAYNLGESVQLSNQYWIDDQLNVCAG